MMRRLTVLTLLVSVLVAGLLTAQTADAATTTAKSLLSKLPVRAETGTSGYSRSAFPYPVDADGDSCDTREEVLIAESAGPIRRGTGCRIFSGRWVSAYDRRTWTRVSDVRVSHLIHAKEAWESGAHRWTADSRRAFANDTRFAWTLNVMTDDLNVAKGTRDPGSWLPPQSRCAYAKHWVAVKHRWRLAVDPAEKTRLAAILTGRCGATTLTVPTRPADTVAPAAPGRPAATVSGSTVALSWTPASDKVGVVGYDIYRSRTATFAPGTTRLAGRSTTSSFSDAGHPAGSAYYRVTARDAAGNVSIASRPAGPVVTSADAITVMAAGDIACPPGRTVTDAQCRHGDVAKVVLDSGASHFIPLGDLQYSSGTYAEFVGAGAYDSAFGPLKLRTLPVIGNHEHRDPAGAGQGYFDYFYGPAVATGPFGARSKAYYSRTIGGWQFVALNSECSSDIHNSYRPLPGGCAIGSAQYRWLDSVLSASTARCTLVAFHRPRWSTGSWSPYAAMGAMWDLMVRKGVDVTISGHNHSTEVFHPIGISGTGSKPVRDPNGIRSFVAGGGGYHLSSTSAGSTAALPALQARDFTTFGPLRLTLHDGSFDWEYSPVAGQAFVNAAGTSGAFNGSGEACR